MVMDAQNFSMYSGDDDEIAVSVVDDEGVAIDLTGATITWSLADSRGGTVLVTKTSDTSAELSITSAAGGTFTIHLLATDTDDLAGVYYHEAQVEDSQGHKTTVLTGYAEIIEDIIN
jgi:hypothetical protein